MSWSTRSVIGHSEKGGGSAGPMMVWTVMVRVRVMGVLGLTSDHALTGELIFDLRLFSVHGTWVLLWI